MKPRYNELKFGGNIYRKRHEVDDILVRRGFGWFLDCEVENARIEITSDTLVFNGGVFYNGVFVYGVIRSGEIRNIRFINGVIHNGVFKQGVFERGIIFGGTFIGGTLKKGMERRGGNIEDGVKIEGDEVGDVSHIVIPQGDPIITTDIKNESFNVVKFSDFNKQ